MSTKSTTMVDVLVGRRLVALRKAKGISQAAVGEAVGVTFQQVQKYEKGQNRIPVARLTTIARLLEVPVSTFFDDGLDEAGEDSPLAHLMLPGASDMLCIYASLPEAGRQALLTASRGLSVAFAPLPVLAS